jgi:lysine 2,3-aminomutase
MIDYLRRSPHVRDVVVSGGDVANMPWPRLEDFVRRLLELDNVHDIRLATKALMGLPSTGCKTTSADRVRPVIDLGHRVLAARSRG